MKDFEYVQNAGRNLQEAGINSQIIRKNQKELRTGYTTGSCAAAAAKAAARMLLSGKEVRQVALHTPKGITLYLEIEEIQRTAEWVSCAVQKDSGDDPDVTNGVYVYAKVQKIAGNELTLEGGAGVGRVTRKGFSQAVGEAAINPVPQRMILEAVESQRQAYAYEGGLSVEISIPAGAELAKKTFNPRLGIEGGLSVLGTSGIVEPMSERALTETIFLEMKVLKENGADYCYVVPGNYGSDFLREKLGYDGELAVKCSNYIGEAMDDAVLLGMKGILFIGHIGKLVKVAAGVMNTHSRQADCRMEVLCTHAALCGADADTVRALMACVTTVEALDILKGQKLLENVMDSVTDKIEEHLQRRAGEMKVGAILFSKEEGILGMTSQAEEILAAIQDQVEEKVCGESVTVWGSDREIQSF